MKTPDKIYVAEVTFPDMIDWDGSPINTRRIDETDIEYIRKDALLEWAEEQEKQALEDLEAGLPIDGKLSAFHRVVEKIESL